MIELRDRLKAYIVENFLFGDDNNFDDSTSFLESGIIDSTGILEVISYLEESFGIKINDNELIPDNLDSIDNIQNFVTRKLGTA